MTLTKAEWRLPSTSRTMKPSEAIEPLVAAALQAWSGKPVSPALIEGGSVRAARECEEIGAFRLTLEGMKLRLDEALCAKQVYQPRRPSRHLGALQPWEPWRLVLNGKADWSSGRFYYLQEYYFVVCDGFEPRPLLPERSVDLQADLH